MRIACALLLALTAGGCGDLFSVDNVPEGYACSAQNRCPPGQQCVPSEHICRTPCTQTSLATMNMGSTPNGQCQNINGGGYSCDYDHFCRPACSSSNGTCGGCSGSDVCDATVNICRPACSAGPCPSTWGCVSVAGTMNGTPQICAGCRPAAASAIFPPVFAPVVFTDGAGAQTTPLAVGDLAGGGHPDVVVADGPTSKLYVYANDGTGALAAPVAYTVPVTPLDTVVADLNRDGKNDVVVATAQAPAGGPVLFPGNGDHTLGGAVAGPMLPTTRLAVGDFDGDGKPDVAESGAGTSELSVVTADGAEGLKQLAAFSTGGTSSYVRIGVIDFNGDGHLDFWADDEHSNIHLFANQNTATLNFSEISGFNGVNQRYDFTSGDLDGDDKPEFIWVQESGTMSPTMPSTVGFAHNDGNGVFTMTTTSQQLQLPASGHLATGDFDGDGHLDVALVEATMTGKSNVDILTGDGKTLLWAEQIAIAKGLPYSIAAADLDGDGKPDLVVGLATGGVAVLLNQTASR